jgi:hypothetical protein
MKKFIETQPKPDEKGFFESLFEGMWSGVKWGLIILVVGFVIIALLAPTYLFPIIGKCVNNEGYSACYIRVTAEEKIIEEFTQCQDACGRGSGSELCLERCEYKYEQGKYKQSNIFTSSKGKSIECPWRTKGFQDNQGNLYCGVD